MTSPDAAAGAGWMITGFQVIIALWVWGAALAAHAIFRLWYGPETDPIRPSGPVDP